MSRVAVTCGRQPQTSEYRQGPVTGKQASRQFTRRVAARPGEMPDGQGSPAR